MGSKWTYAWEAEARKEFNLPNNPITVIGGSQIKICDITSSKFRKKQLSELDFRANGDIVRISTLSGPSWKMS